ncbi:MAG: hypothetical protein ACOCVG_00675 [Verrucomicrobiota bacterium]
MSMAGGVWPSVVVFGRAFAGYNGTIIKPSEGILWLIFLVMLLLSGSEFLKQKSERRFMLLSLIIPPCFLFFPALWAVLTGGASIADPSVLAVTCMVFLPLALYAGIKAARSLVSAAQK